MFSSVNVSANGLLSYADHGHSVFVIYKLRLVFDIALDVRKPNALSYYSEVVN